MSLITALPTNGSGPDFVPSAVGLLRLMFNIRLFSSTTNEMNMLQFRNVDKSNDKMTFNPPFLKFYVVSRAGCHVGYYSHSISHCILMLIHKILYVLVLLFSSNHTFFHSPFCS